MCNIRFLAFGVALLITATVQAQDGWFLFRGNPQRTGVASNLPAWEKVAGWQRPLFNDKVDGFDADDDAAVQAFIEKYRKGVEPTILPGSFPLIVGDTCIYRDHRGIVAVTFKARKLVDDVGSDVVHVPAGGIMWKSIPHGRSLSGLLEKFEGKRNAPILADALAAKKQEAWIWANPMVGSVSSDGKVIYAIDDFPFTPVPNPPFPKFKGPKWPGDIKLLATTNRLLAYHSEWGKLLWETEDAFWARGGDPTVFDKTHFLGAPLSDGGKLYVLNEKDVDLRLVRIDLDRKKWKSTSLAEPDKIVSLVKIADADKALVQMLRRTQPLHLALAGDLLICPTHAGVVVGVDRATMDVRWTYRYRDDKASSPALPVWQAACPIVHKDRIVFTAADGPEVHCIDLKGQKQWSAKADGDLYLASVFEDIVLLVGKTHCRALKLADGTEKWKLQTGLPAGVGVQDGKNYYLPLKHKDGPTIWSLNLTNGNKPKAVAVPVPYPDALGNLILHHGMFVSQSVTHIAAFPLK